MNQLRYRHTQILYFFSALFIIVLMAFSEASVTLQGGAAPEAIAFNGQENWEAPPEADKLKNPSKGDKAATKAGKKTFQSLCSVCHGEKGQGDGPAGVALDPRPANLTSSEVQDQTDGAIFWKITNGNPPMTSYKDALTEKQRWELVNYIRTLSNN